MTEAVTAASSATAFQSTVPFTLPRQESELVSTALLEDVVANAWWHVLGAGLHRLHRVAPGVGTDVIAAADIAVTAALPLFGAHALVVVLRASRGVAADAAVSLLGLHREELAPGDIDDAFGNLVSAVGAGLCDVLPAVTIVGTPVIIQGAALTSAVPHARLSCDTSLRSGSGRVHVSLWRPRA